ncbi:MAG: nuclear transport factor 2 family protein [Methylocystis sp.]|uniref:nuclear transport factor 2 family protein n=1 Tax=Methylocystis sp. TaxID=1911079 RepID=UPI003DA3F6A9
MSVEDRNVAILQEAYRRWHDSKGGSIEHWSSILAPEVDFRSLAQGQPEPISFTKPRQGPSDVEKYLKELTADWEMIDYVVDRFVAQGDHVVAIGRTAWRNKSTGKVADTPKVDLWRFSAEGKALEFFEYYDTAMVIAAAS